MHRTKRVFWGLCFIAIAVMVLLNQTGVLNVTLSAGKIIIGILALAKYVNSTDFRGASVKNSFGELKVYFDKAIVLTSPIDIKLSNSFGELQVFVPKNWNVKLDVNVFAGDCKNEPHTGNEDWPQVRISGDVSFGEIQIIYV
ncbi:MAG: LiaF-related protein [Lachnospiraceae bacterium]|nr:LiaF-related protein [Lachnospiraceae bacterium]